MKRGKVCVGPHVGFAFVITSCTSPPPLPPSLELVSRVFVRKLNPALTLIQGQRNSCNLSLYLLGSLFSSSRTLTLYAQCFLC